MLDPGLEGGVVLAHQDPVQLPGLQHDGVDQHTYDVVSKSVGLSLKVAQEKIGHSIHF